MERLQQNPSTDLAPFSAKLADVVQRVDGFLSDLLQEKTELNHAIAHSVLNGGKRFRPFLTIAVSDLFEVPPQQSLRTASAIELVHTYSLIHDDLPAMDDAHMRRGKPSCHIQYDEATAILAGDALIPFAFELLSSEATHPDPSVRISLIHLLAKAIGPQGMPLGQMMDLGREGPLVTLDDLIRMESLKTGELIRCACKMGAILGQATPEQMNSLDTYGTKLGLVFQIVDDILDATVSNQTLGKPVQQDAQKGKATFIELLDLDEARKLAKNYADEAIEELKNLPSLQKTLADAAYFALSRTQ